MNQKDGTASDGFIEARGQFAITELGQRKIAQFLAIFSASDWLLVPEKILTSDMGIRFSERFGMDLRAKIVIFEWMTKVFEIHMEDNFEFKQDQAIS